MPFLSLKKNSREGEAASDSSQESPSPGLMPQLSGRDGVVQEAIATCLSLPNTRLPEAEELLKGSVEAVASVILPIRREELAVSR